MRKIPNFLSYLIVILLVIPQPTFQAFIQSQLSKIYPQFNQIEDWKSILNPKNQLQINKNHFCNQKYLYCDENEIKNKIDQIIEHNGSKITNFNQELLNLWQNFFIKDKSTKNSSQDSINIKQQLLIKQKQFNRYKACSNLRTGRKISSGFHLLSIALGIDKSILTEIPLKTITSVIQDNNTTPSLITTISNTSHRLILSKIIKIMNSDINILRKCKNVVSRMTFSIKKITNIKAEGMENLLNTNQLKNFPLPSLKKVFTAVFKNQTANIWISEFQKLGTDCMYGQKYFMKNTICSMCSKQGNFILTNDQKIIIKKQACTNVLNNCMIFWRKLIEIQEEFSKIEVEKKMSINGHATTLIEAISKNGDFWKIVQQNATNLESQAILCQGFVNILNRTPPILRNQEVKAVLGALKITDDDNSTSSSSSSSNFIGRQLYMASSQQFLFEDVNVETNHDLNLPLSNINVGKSPLDIWTGESVL